MVEPVFVCFPRRRGCCQPGAAVIIDSHRDCWEPGQTRVLTDFQQECVSVLCQDSTSKLNLNLKYRLSELVNHFEQELRVTRR